MRCCIPLMLATLLVGCSPTMVPAPKDEPLSGDLAIERVKKTAEYRALESKSGKPLIMVVDATGKDVRIEVQQEVEGDARLPVASFKARRDGRVYIWDDTRGDWRVIATYN